MKSPYFRFVVVLGSLLVAVACLVAARSSAEPLASGDVAAPTEPQSPEVKAAADAFKKRDFEGALKQLKEAVKKDPELSPANVILAQWFSQNNIPAGVRSALDQAVTEAPDDPESYIIMGEIAIRDRRITEADLLFQKAASVMQKFNRSGKRKTALQQRLFGGLASVDEARENWVDAQKEFEAWLKIDPKNAAPLQRLAHSLFQQKKPDAALENLRTAVKLDDELLTPEAVLARWYEQTGDRANAEKWMAAALNAAPTNAKTRVNAAQWAIETGQIDEAKTQAEAALKLDPKSFEAKIVSGVVCLFKKDYKGAEVYFESAHLQAPGDFAASNNLALALVEQKDDLKKKRALEYAEGNVRRYPKVADAVSTYGWVLYKLGKLDEAEQALKLAASGGFNPDTAYYMACLSVDRGREEDAKQLLENALKSKAPFLQRQEAQAWLDRLNK